jgi:hypothetical protein
MTMKGGSECPRRHRVLQERETPTRVVAVDQEANSNTPEEHFLAFSWVDHPGLDPFSSHSPS